MRDQWKLFEKVLNSAYACNENSLQKAEEALQNGEGLGGIKEEAAEAGPVKENDGTEKTKQKSSVKKKNTIPVPAADLNFCLTKTNLDKPKIAQWWKLVHKTFYTIISQSSYNKLSTN